MIECLASHDHHQWEIHEIFARTRKNKTEKRKKKEEQLREKERIEFDPQACTTSKSIFVQNEVTNCHNLPFGGRETHDSRVRVPRKKYARSRHQRSFKENVGKTGKDVIYKL